MSRTFWCLYREPFAGAPLTAWFKSDGFRAPRRDESLTSNLMALPTNEDAERIAKTLLSFRSLLGPALVCKRSHLIKRIRANAAS